MDQKVEERWKKRMEKRMEKRMIDVSEYKTLRSLIRGRIKSPVQKNDLFTSDCEILRLGTQHLVLTCDALSEEIDIGLYQDPYLWGWMTAMSSISDLAASGAKPLGFLLSAEWKYKVSLMTKKRFYLGLKSALKSCDVPFLGGDSGVSRAHSFCGFMAGQSKHPPLDRMGIRPGDRVVMMNERKTGWGPALAFQYLFGAASSGFKESSFRPRPNWKRIHEMRPWVRASIDTSDGIATSIYILSGLNKVGFDMTFDEKFLAPGALRLCRKLKLHPLMLWIGNHGDFETLLIVANEKWPRFKRKYPEAVILGVATKDPRVHRVYCDKKWISWPLQKITNCPRKASQIKKWMQGWNWTLLDA